MMALIAQCSVLTHSRQLSSSDGKMSQSACEAVCLACVCVWAKRAALSIQLSITCTYFVPGMRHVTTWLGTASQTCICTMCSMLVHTANAHTYVVHHSHTKAIHFNRKLVVRSLSMMAQRRAHVCVCVCCGKHAFEKLSHLSSNNISSANAGIGAFRFSWRWCWCWCRWLR